MGGSVDNFWLLMTMRYGVPAFLMLAFAIFVMVRQATKLPLTSPVDQACRTGYLISLAGVIIAGGTVDYWHSMLSFFMFMVGAGMWLCTADQAPDHDLARRRRVLASGVPGGEARRSDRSRPAHRPVPSARLPVGRNVPDAS